MLLKNQYISYILTTKNMGSKQSSVIRVPQISKEQWQQIAIPSTIKYKSSYGQYKLYSNVLTNQKTQQYCIFFQQKQDYEQYVESFKWREREQNIVNTKYLQHVSEDSLCGTRIFIKVYIDHTIYRLSSVNDIPIPQNLYLLSSALNGFQKLYQLIGYFKPNEDMIGIDTQGRAKVWLSSNFSKNYLYGPHYVQGFYSSKLSVEDKEAKMVMQIISLVEENTFYEGNQFPKFISFLESCKAKLTFANIKQLIIDYSKRYGLTIPKYFVSLLHLFQLSNQSQQEQSQSDKFTHDPFKVSQSNIVQNNSNIIHYIDPELKSEQKIEQSEKQLRSLTKIEQQFIQLQRQGDTTGETMFKNSFKSSSNIFQPKIHKQPKKQLPEIRFQYVSRSRLQPHQQPKFKAQQIVPQMHLSLSKISQNALLESARLTRRLTYSDISDEYQLDQQLAEDLLKYFNN